MFGNVKALIVVLLIAATVFRLAKPIALQFISEDDFLRRRRVWFILTAVSFLSPNFWLYTLVAVPVLIWANRRDSSAVGLYLMLLHVVPPVGVEIPILGNNGLFPLDNYRLLAIFVLIPAIMRFHKSRAQDGASHIRSMDMILLAFGVLQVALYTPPDLPSHYVIPDSPTNVLRRAVLFFFDTYVVYFAFSRTCQSRRQIVDCVATFCLATSIMAALAVFEHLRHWLLYTDIARLWSNDLRYGFYLMRNGSVRAQVSAGHSIALGHLLAVAFGFWLYLGSQLRNRLPRIAVTILIGGGLYATYSRGAWLGAAVVYFAFLVTGKGAISRLAKGSIAALAIAGAILVSPIGDQILGMLPKTGQPADLYRHRLAERGWELVMAHPFFGDQLPWPEMEGLRQGEGIIDLVNSYLEVSLNYGLIGLFCFLSFILLGLASVWTCTRKLADSEANFALLGTSIMAGIIGTLVMIESNSFHLGPQKIFYVLAGLAVAYARLAKSQSEDDIALTRDDVSPNLRERSV